MYTNLLITILCNWQLLLNTRTCVEEKTLKPFTLRNTATSLKKDVSTCLPSVQSSGIQILCSLSLSNFAVKYVVNLKRGKVVSSATNKFKTIYKSDGVTYPRINCFCLTSPLQARLRVYKLVCHSHTCASPNFQKPLHLKGGITKSTLLRLRGLRSPTNQNSLPFSKKWVTTRIPAAAAVPGPTEGAESPEGEEAEEGEVKPFSALRFSRFLFFLEDMIRKQPVKGYRKAGSTCSFLWKKNFRGRSQRDSALRRNPPSGTQWKGRMEHLQNPPSLKKLKRF